MSVAPTISRQAEYPRESAVPGTSVDYDLHGLAGVRLIDATPRDRAVVDAQLGPIAAPLAREPDITIRFVDRIPLSGSMRLLGVDDVGYTDDTFLVLRTRHKTRARVAIPFDRVGGACEIVCERGLPAVPLLIPILNLTVLANGGLPMHASAFRFADAGVLVTGWSKGGKTETLLGFMLNGAEYIGDEWIYLDADGRMFGIPEPIRVWDWHLEQVPSYRQRLSLRHRARLTGLRYVSGSLNTIAGALDGTSTRWSRSLRRVTDLLDRQRYGHLAPRAVFGSGFGSLRGVLEKIVLVASHDSPDTTVEPADAATIAERMSFSLQEERSSFMATYRKFRFAFPDRGNPLVELAPEIERERLQQVLEGKEAYAVYHPYPPTISELFAAVRPLVEG
jgi:hypothetical protein